MKKWPQEDIDYLTKNYATTRTDEISRVINKSIATVHVMAFRLDLKKTKAYISQITSENRGYLPRKRVTSTSKWTGNAIVHRIK